MITDTLEGRVKLAYANGLTDEQIAAQEDVSVALIEHLLVDSRLPIRITGISVNQDDSMLRVVRAPFQPHTDN